LLIKEWNLIRSLNHDVSYLFCIYQIFLLTSTFIGPSTVIIIVAGKQTQWWIHPLRGVGVLGLTASFVMDKMKINNAF
jgi:chitin synthase